MDQGHKETDKKLKALENRLSREYKNAYNTVKKRADAYFKRFDVEDKEKQKLIKKGELSASDYAQWRFERMAGGQHFRDLCNVLTEDMINADKIAVSIINGHLPEVYADNVNFGTYEIESGANISTSFTLYDKDTVENLMKKDPHVIPQAKIDIPKDERWNRRKLTSALTQGILAGDSIPHIAERLKQVTDMDTRAAIRNARTYTTAAENKGRMDSYERAEEMGINMKKQWVATLDDRTRHTHRLLDGVAIDIDEEFDNGLQFPGDPDGDDEEIYNCRCTLIAKLGDYNFKSNYRNSKLDGISYDEWKGLKESGKETPVSFADKIKEIIQKANDEHYGVLPEDIMEAGKIFAQEINDNYIAPIQKEYDDAKAIIDEYNRQTEEIRKELRTLDRLLGEYYSGEDISQQLKDLGYKSIEDTIKKSDDFENLIKNMWTPEHTAAYNKMEETRKKMSAGVSHFEYMKNKIAEIRPVGADGLDLKGHLKNSRSPMRKVVEKAYSGYPTEWVQKSINKGQLTVKKTQRGYYNSWYNEIAISGTGDESSLSTAVHELGHRFEDTIPYILAEEGTFYSKRTDGEMLEWLGYPYDLSEKTRKDKFLNAYMGKDYGGSAYELVSMGFQYAYMDPFQLAKDPDMQQWILGLLCSV